MPNFYEFFAGGGMARAGLGPGWRCLFANDFDHKKGLAYQANWGTGGELKIGDVRKVTASELSEYADLVWGSFPCQDLSLAGGGAGLKGERSGTFYPFWDVITGLIDDNRAPKIVAIENVCGTLTSHGGRDFEAICKTFANAGYRYGPLIVNASLFLPQSRPRLFVIGVRQDVTIDPAFFSPEPIEPFHTRGLRRAVEGVSSRYSKKMLWWNLPTPPHRKKTFADIIEENPSSVEWHTAAETNQILAKMSAVNRAKVEAAKRSGRRMVAGRLQAHPVRRKWRKGAAGGNSVRRCCGVSAHTGRRLKPTNNCCRRRTQDSLAPHILARDCTIDGARRWIQTAKEL